MSSLRFFKANKETQFTKLVIILFWPIIAFSTVNLTGQSIKPAQRSGKKIADSLYLESRKLVRSDSERAIELGEKLISLSKALEYKIGIAKGMETIARAHLHNKSFEKSITLAKKAFAYSKEVGADSILLETINILGAANYRVKRIHKTFEYNSLGRKYAKEFDNWEKGFLFTANAASIMVALQEYEKALLLFEEAEKILKKHPNNSDFTLLYIEIASAYNTTGNIPMAIEYLKKAKAYATKIENRSLNLDILLLEGNVQLKQHLLPEAKKTVKVLDSMLLGSNDIRSAVELNILKANIELSQNNISAAETFVETSIPLAEKVSIIGAKISLLELLYKIKQRKEDFKNANVALESLKKLQDSIDFSNNLNSIRISIAEKTFKQEQELLGLKLQKARLNQIYIALIATIIVLSLLSILYLIRRNSINLQRVNRDLEYQKERLNEANITKDKLFSIIGHDLKGPISNMKTMFDMLISEQITTKDFQRFAPNMRKKINHIDFSLNNLLAWGMTQLKGDYIAPKHFVFNTIVKNTTDLLQDAFLNKKITLINNLENNSMVWADEHQIEIVVRNLLSNAIKFTPEGGKIYVDARKTPEHLEISITDTGLGMSEEIKNRIFEKNEKISTRGTNDEEGTGLGLSICIDMVQKNNGKIWVTSQPEKGTSINFTLPSKAPGLKESK